ncbi:MAG TPA: signal peptidase I [Gaiellaceae bacterium]|jgi:signal peptidase|nr:signal peptidase I [Gaiellaceae bacterium]
MQMRLTTVLQRTAGLVTGLAVLAAVAYAVLFLAGYRPVVVYSGSMEPGLGVGSLAFVQSVPSAEVEVGDVITFGDPRRPGRLVTHRVVEAVEREGGGLAYRTKGDANEAVDPWAIALPEQAGRLAFDVPYAGYPLWYAQTREVRTGLILLVAGLVLAGLLRAIWRAPAAREVPAA